MKPTDTLFVVLAVGFVLFVVALIVVSRRRAAKRAAELSALAQEAGWTFSADSVEPGALGLGSLPLFTYGRRGTALNISRATSPAPLCIFDYRYTVGSGKNQRTVLQTVVHVEQPRASLPPFVLSPENVLHKVGGLFGYHDIDFESSPEFSQRYLLRSKEAESRVRDLFSPSVRAYFEQREPVTIEAAGTGVLVYRDGVSVAPSEMRAFVDEALTVARQFTA